MVVPYLINRVFSGWKMFRMTTRDLTLIVKTLWPVSVNFDIMPYMVTITPQNVFFVHLVVDNATAIFAMSVAVSCCDI